MSTRQTLLDKKLEQFDKAPIITAESSDHPAILGGFFGPERLAAFLTHWQQRQKMQWRIWEYIHTITFADPVEPIDYLLRADLFGEGGHVALRRDANRWLWHAIGSKDMQVPDGITQPPECEDFWASPQANGIVLRRYEETALLWGEKRIGTNFWHDDRVGRAHLVYPNMRSERVQLRFWRFTEGGQTAFVWYRGLEGVAREEQSND